MHPRIWVYRRNLSSNPQSPFHSQGNEKFTQRVGCYASGFLGFLFLALALLCLFSPDVDKQRTLFLIFIGLCVIFEVIFFMYCCFSGFKKYCRNSNDEEEGYSTRSLLSSDENVYDEVFGTDGMTNYPVYSGYPEVPNYENVPSNQSVKGYREFCSYPIEPRGAEGGFHPGLSYLRPLANYEGVFGYQQIPVYQEDLVEPQLPPFYQAHGQSKTVPQHDILVY